jgi:hypothetical protein
MVIFHVQVRVAVQ